MASAVHVACGVPAAFALAFLPIASIGAHAAKFTDKAIVALTAAITEAASMAVASCIPHAHRLHTRFSVQSSVAEITPWACEAIIALTSGVRQAASLFVTRGLPHALLFTLLTIFCPRADVAEFAHVAIKALARAITKAPSISAACGVPQALRLLFAHAISTERALIADRAREAIKASARSKVVAPAI